MQAEVMDCPDNIIECYALEKFTYREISTLLRKYFGGNISPNAIGKRLKRSGMLSKRGPTIHDEAEVRNAIELLLHVVPCAVRYRQITERLHQMDMHVRRDTVMKIIKDIDPVGVEYRRRRRINRKVYRTRGPNHVWHVDGYDKLKPFGFPIHGCIDGFSRRIMWLTVGPSNNDPTIVAHNFENLNGCPMILQTDPGTENNLIGALQCVFRHNAGDCFSGINSYRVVKSVFNQRIEAWWSTMRSQHIEWWINFFKELEAFGGFWRGNETHVYGISFSFCFM